LSSVISKKIALLQKQGANIVIITDSNVKNHQSKFIKSVFGELPILTIRAGEKSKSTEILNRVYSFLIRNKVDRKSYIIALGGGVVGDLAGFAAATFLRGIRFIQIPTTLLAMVDSSVGGKTGINLVEGKNLVGAFHQPEAVYIGTNLLQTLPSREFNAGMAEILKSGLLGDLSLWKMLAQEAVTEDSPVLPKVIKKTFLLKAHIVTADEKEINGARALLNLGHTFGHAIENVSGYGKYLHGEAVAIGLGLAAELSLRLKYISPEDVFEIKKTILKYHLPIKLRTSLPIAKLNKAMTLDKKSEKGNMKFVLLQKIGAAFSKDEIPSKLISDIWKTAMPSY